MIKIFSPTDTDFSSNGDIVVQATRAVVHKTDNGDYYLELECGLEYEPYIQPNNLVVVPTPQGEQAFRLEASIEKTGYKISAKAWHVYYDTENYLIADTYIVNRTCEDALNRLNNAVDNPSPFTTSSDVQTIDSFRCVRKSLYEAVETVLERWGGHLVRDNFHFSIMNSIGEDNGVTIQYRKNLKEISVTEDWSEVCTKCLPVGKDGYLLDELYLESEVQYPIPYTKTVSFEQDIEREDYPSDEAYYNALREDLIHQCEEYLKVAQYPSINYTLSANIEKITDVGDHVEVFDERLGVSLSASVLSFEYDAILEKYIFVEFGSIGNSLSNLLGSVSSEINSSLSSYTEDITAYLNQAVAIATGEIWERLGSSYVIFSGNELVISDALPVEDATNLIKFDRFGMSFSDTGVLGEFRKIIGMEGSFYASNINMIGLTLSMIAGGTLDLGGIGNNKGNIIIYGSDNTPIGSIGYNGLTLNNTNVIDEIRAKDGEVFSESNEILSGYIHNSASVLSFTVPSRKTLKDISSIMVSSLRLNVSLSGGGYLFTYTSGGYDIISDSDLTVSVEKHNDYITINITTVNPWSVPDGSSVTVIVESLEANLT